MELSQLIYDLFNIGAVKFGEFRLKSGILSPIYFDFRLIVSYPLLLQKVGDAMWEKAKDLPFDLLCGVPYTALPIATYLSIAHQIPQVIRRKEAKQYGTGLLIEGAFEKGNRCLVIEDLITSGASILETIDPLEAAGLEATHAIVFLDREQGGRDRLKGLGKEVISVIGIHEMLEILIHKQVISQETKELVVEFISKNNFKEKIYEPQSC